MVSRERIDADLAVEELAPAIRPAKLGEYVGQPSLIERVSIAIRAVRERGDPMEHVLLHGPPGLGKTTLAHVIAHEMGSRAVVTSGPALTRPGDLVGTLTRLEARDVLFIDEIHRLPAAVEEYIYPAMEDLRVDFTVDSGMHSRVITLPIKPFTLIGATTRAGLLTHALRSRFGIAHHLDFYGQDELIRILRRAAEVLGMGAVAAPALSAIASRSRGTPRVAIRLLRRVRDFAQVRNAGRVDDRAVSGALELEGVDPLGLDELDRRYLRTIATTYEGGPVGVEAVAATLSDDSGTLEDVVEPFLLQIGFLARTRQGRKLTPAAWSHLGLDAPAGARDGRDDLFDRDAATGGERDSTIDRTRT
ncbi:MAG: Holliday junction branch migration DNA helicase RuvB [Phycisphaerae bacterium]|nr:Holliday junction branch migration DNA helicase RuvB [Phycisphaerae bacterium]